MEEQKEILFSRISKSLENYFHRRLGSSLLIVLGIFALLMIPFTWHVHSFSLGTKIFWLFCFSLEAAFCFFMSYKLKGPGGFK